MKLINFFQYLKGRKSRRERRIAKEKRLKERGSLSPLSFIVKDEPAKNKSNDQYNEYFEGGSRSYRSSHSRSRSRSRSRHRKRSRSRSHSNSPISAKHNKVLFITSFGAEDPDEPSESKNAEMTLKQSKVNLANSAVFNAKLLKNQRSSMSPRSRSRSVSPLKESNNVKTASVSLFKNRYFLTFDFETFGLIFI